MGTLERENLEPKNFWRHIYGAYSLPRVKCETQNSAQKTADKDRGQDLLGCGTVQTMKCKTKIYLGRNCRSLHLYGNLLNMRTHF